jgi:hypothetical protein
MYFIFGSVALAIGVIVWLAMSDRRGRRRNPRDGDSGTGGGGDRGNRRDGD